MGVNKIFQTLGRRVIKAHCWALSGTSGKAMAMDRVIPNQAHNYAQAKLKVIPQKKKLSNDFLGTFPECSLLIPVLRTAKKIGHRACLRNIMGQSYPIDACTDTNHTRSSAQGTFCRS